MPIRIALHVTHRSPRQNAAAADQFFNDDTPGESCGLQRDPGRRPSQAAHDHASVCQRGIDWQRLQDNHRGNGVINGACG
jgi:hypothetical protein